MSTKLRIATRGSALALRQAEIVAGALRAAHPHVEIELMIVRTVGDQNQSAPVAQLGDGAFVRGVEAALLDGSADAAVHSAKDMPTIEPPALVIAAFPERADPRDVLVSRTGQRFAELPNGARLGTGSPRRAAIARVLHGGLDVQQIRGNVDTRLRKLDAGEYDAIVLAAAGLARMGWLDRVTEYLDPSQWVPPAGQGAIAVQCRAVSPAAGLLSAIDHAPTRAAVTAERAVLRRLGAGCRVPLGVHGTVIDGELNLTAHLVAPDGARSDTLSIRAHLGEPFVPARRKVGFRLGARVRTHDPEEIGASLAEHLLPRAEELTRRMEE